MPAATTLDTIRTGTPDASGGNKLAQISAQEDATKEIVGGVSLSDRIADTVSPDRTGVTGNDTATTDMSTSGFAGAAGANLVAINNRGALAVWCQFEDTNGTATIEIIFYDNANNPLFISEPLSFSAKTQVTDAGPGGKYMSQVQLVDTYGASKFRPYVKSLTGSSGTDVYANPL